LNLSLPIEVGLNDRYKAIVDANGDVQVGCQVFAAAKVLELAEAIKKVQANK